MRLDARKPNRLPIAPGRPLLSQSPAAVLSARLESTAGLPRDNGQAGRKWGSGNGEWGMKRRMLQPWLEQSDQVRSSPAVKTVRKLCAQFAAASHWSLSPSHPAPFRGHARGRPHGPGCRWRSNAASSSGRSRPGRHRDCRRRADRWCWPRRPGRPRARRRTA